MNAMNLSDSKRTIPFSPPDIGEAEIAGVAEVLRSGWITTGPRTKLLERRLADYIDGLGAGSGHASRGAAGKGGRRVVCLSSATAAEELNLRVLGIGPGDEVVCPAYTYTATASAAAHCGATVRLVDIQRDGDPLTHMPEMDYGQLERAITDRTKAVIPVDLGGVVCDYERIFEIVEGKRRLFRPSEGHGGLPKGLSARIQEAIGRVAVVGDCAHSLGARRMVGGEWRGSGAIADFSSFSFHAVKNLTTAEGGAATWDLSRAPGGRDGGLDEEIYRAYQLLSLHGQDRDAMSKSAGAWEYDVVGLWYKCNMADVVAAIGLGQLDRYGGLLARRRQIVDRYDRACDELGISHLVHETGEMQSSCHLYLARIPGIGEGRRNEIIRRMAERGVATNVHYKPLPMMTAYKKCGYSISDFPNAYDYYKNLISLPLHTRLSDDDVEYVCEVLGEAVGK